MPDAASALSQPRLLRAAEILHALTHPLRLRIVDHMTGCAEGATVLDLQGALEQEAGVLSNHLRVLRQSGVITTTRSGKYINYQLAEERLSHISTAVSEFADGVGEVIA